MKWNGLSRRHFLQGAGAAMLALPFLGSLAPKRARAATTPKHFIGIATQNGLYKMYGPESQLMPQTPESNGSLVGLTPTVLQGQHTIHSGSLSAMAQANGGRISDLIDASYTPYLDRMLMMQGFDYIGLGWFHHHGQFGDWHQTAGQTDGNPEMATLDVVLSDYYKSQGLPSEMVGYSASDRDINYGNSVHADGSLTTNRFNNPATLWDKYFGNSTVSTDVKTLLVDRVLSDYQSLRTNPRLGSMDKQKLEAHIAFLAETDAKVKQLGAVCSQMRPDASIADRSVILQTMNNVIVGLISCGMCNLFIGWAEALVNEDPDQWHVWSHQGYDNDNDAIANQTAYDSMVLQSRTLMNDMCLDLAKKLDQVGELDNSLIVCIQEHNKRGHESWNIPVITFGSAGGTLTTGQYVDFRNVADRDDLVYSRYGFPMNQLYANVLQAMGMPPAAFEPLNKSRDGSSSSFKANSGYGVPVIHPDAVSSIGANHYDTWAPGYDMSGWLPLIK